VTRGTSYENRGNLAPAFFDQIIRKYEGTRFGRQELEAELLEDTPGALWSHGSIEASRLRSAPAMTRVAVAIDPAVTSGEEADETGIVVAGKDENGHGYVLADLSGRYPPIEWARLAITAYRTHRADRIVEPRQPRDCRRDLLDHAVDEVLLLGIAGHVLKRQDRERRLVGERQRSSDRQRRAERAEIDTIGAHRSCDVFDLLLAEIVEGDVEAVAHLLVRRGTEANPARLSQRFKSGCNVDAVAEDIAILDDDVADIDAHAKFDAALCRCGGVAGHHLPLHLDRTAHRVDDTAELGKEAVAGSLDDATAMLGDFGITELTANRPQRRERALLIFAHQPRIAGNIDRQNGRQSSLDPPFAHLARPVPQEICG
jgi:hypothetical protein